MAECKSTVDSLILLPLRNPVNEISDKLTEHLLCLSTIISPEGVKESKTHTLPLRVL